MQQRDKVTAREGGQKAGGKEEEKGKATVNGCTMASLNWRAAMQGVSNRPCFQLVCDPLQVSCR